MTSTTLEGVNDPTDTNLPTTAPPTSSVQLDAARLALNAAWLAQLRWVAVAGQLVTIAFVMWLKIALPIAPLLVLVAVTAATNAVFTWWVRSRRQNPFRDTGGRVWHVALGGLMLLDLLVLSAMLSLTGGPTNPFVIFYFVNLALCGVLLPARWAWLLNAMAIVAFAVITYRHLPLAVLRDADRLRSFAELGETHVVGIGALAAFAACSTVIVSFATRLTKELRAAQQERLNAEELRSRSEKLEALGTLAAGAAHELATPLSAIAVAAGELQRELAQQEVSSDALEDVTLIRESLDRCRRILDRMSTESGHAAGEAPKSITVAKLLEEVLAELADRSQVALSLPEAVAQIPLYVPPTALAQALRAIVQNALDVSSDVTTDNVLIEADLNAAASQGSRSVQITITDRGSGMPAEVVARAAEPFFTTKDPGSGMGLGLFLARSVIERIGGKLSIASQTGQGTTVSVRLNANETSAS